MKLTRIKTWLVAGFALANGFFAAAQSNGVPGDTDYARFSQFITDRNIFDPNRYPRSQRGRTTYTRTRTRTRTAGAPEFSLVGTMSYSKGMFVFFDGNSSDLKKILAGGGSIADYTVQDVTSTSVKLVGADKKEIVMQLGDQMQQEGGSWQLVHPAELSSGPAAATDNENPATTTEPDAVAPSPSLQANDVLKRLMQLREQELK
jgi:hypothetical protein